MILMKTLFTAHGSTHADSDIFLRDTVDVLVSNIENPSFQRSSFILNDIPEEITIDTDRSAVIAVLRELLAEVVEHTESGCIRITAKTFNNIVLIHIKNDGLLHYHAMLPNLTGIHLRAEKLGGFVGFTSFRNKVTTIAFSFTNSREEYCLD